LSGVDALLLVGLGLLAGLLLRGGWALLRTDPSRALLKLANRRSASLRSDAGGIVVAGVEHGRNFSITWRWSPDAPPVLLVGLDCATSATGPVEVGGLNAEVDDAALAVCMVDPPRAWLDADRLEGLLGAMAALAEELERGQPGGEEPD